MVYYLITPLLKEWINQQISKLRALQNAPNEETLRPFTHKSVCPPSFDLLDQFDLDVVDETQSSFVMKSPVKLMSESRVKSSTPYAYSKSNLILVVEEGQPMFDKLLNVPRYIKLSILKPDGITYTQLHLTLDNATPVKKIDIIDDMKTSLLNVGNPPSNSIFVSSPDFWASAAAFADALENSLCSKNVFKGEDISDVVRRIDFSPTISTAPKSPFVSSMIKRVKNRNSEKIAKKKQKERELHLITTNNGQLVPKLNEETKCLVMKPESKSLSFYLITNDSVTCFGQHLNDILQHKPYDVMLVNVFFSVLRAELIEKCVHESKFQFVNPELFDNEYSDRTTQVVPDLVNYRNVKIHNSMVTASMNGDFKRHGRFFVISMRTMTHWHFLVWPRSENKYTHYDSNREIRGAVNDGAAKRTALWMTKWFQEFLFIDRHSEPEFIDCMTYPQEINSKLDGGLYMLQGISCLIDYLHIEDGVFNNISLEAQMLWKKTDVPKIRNCMFRRLSERMEYGDWTAKMENSNRGNKRFKRR